MHCVWMCNEIGIVTCAAHLKQYRWQQTHDVFQYSFVAERLTGLRLKYTGLYTCLARAAHDARSHWGWGLGGQKSMPERVHRYRRRLTTQQKDERQDNRDRRWLVRQHPSDLLRSLTPGRIGGGQHAVVSTALWATPFRPIKLSMCSANDAHTYT